MSRWINQKIKKNTIVPYDYYSVSSEDYEAIVRMEVPKQISIQADCEMKDLIQRESQYHIYPESSISCHCPQLGSRVVIVQHATIPFGSQGTVVGAYLEKKWIEVVLDHPTIAGSGDECGGRIV